MTALASVLATLNTYQGGCGRSIFGSHSAITAAKKYIKAELDAVNPNTSDTLTQEQKSALAKIFIRTHPIKAGSQSENIWKEIIRKHFPPNPQETLRQQHQQQGQLAATPKPNADADYVHANLQCLEKRSSASIDLLDGINSLLITQTSPIVALQAIVNSYETKRNKSYTGTKHSSAMHKATQIINQLPLFHTVNHRSEYRETLTPEEQYQLIMSFFGNYGTTIKKTSGSYTAFSSIIKLFSTKINLTEIDINKIHSNIIALKNGGHLNDKTKCVETLLACINDPKNFTVPAKASTSLFHGYARIAPELILPPYSIAELKQLKTDAETNANGSVKGFIAKETLTSILTRGVEKRFKQESADLKTFYVNNCFYHGALIGSQTFSEPDAIFTQLKEFLAPLTDLPTLASKLKNLLKDLSSEDSDRIPMAMKQYLFLQCAQFPTDPDFNPILWQLMPKELLAATEQPNTLLGIIQVIKGAYVRIESPLPNSEDTHVRFIEDKELEAIALKTKASLVNPSNEDLTQLLHALDDESKTYQQTIDKLLPHSTITDFLIKLTPSMVINNNPIKQKTLRQSGIYFTSEITERDKYVCNILATFKDKDKSTLKNDFLAEIKIIKHTLPIAASQKIIDYLLQLKKNDITNIPIVDRIRRHGQENEPSSRFGDTNTWLTLKEELRLLRQELNTNPADELANLDVERNDEYETHTPRRSSFGFRSTD